MEEDDDDDDFYNYKYKQHTLGFKENLPHAILKDSWPVWYVINSFNGMYFQSNVLLRAFYIPTKP